MGFPTTRSSSGRGRGGGSGSHTRSGRGYNRTRSSRNNNSKNKSEQSTGQIKFQLHGQKVRQTVTYSKVLEHLIVKIQTTFDRPILIVKSLREMKKNAPKEPERTRVKIEGTDEEKEKKIFDQQTVDMKITQDSKWKL